jgi:hypothetical protein
MVSAHPGGGWVDRLASSGGDQVAAVSVFLLQLYLFSAVEAGVQLLGLHLCSCHSTSWLAAALRGTAEARGDRPWGPGLLTAEWVGLLYGCAANIANRAWCQ